MAVSSSLGGRDCGWMVSRQPVVVLLSVDGLFLDNFCGTVYKCVCSHEGPCTFWLFVILIFKTDIERQVQLIELMHLSKKVAG